MKKSAGIVMCHVPTKSVLLLKPKGAKYEPCLSIPKGGIEIGETPFQAAVRETVEEVGIYLLDADLPKEHYVCTYLNKKGKTYKTVDCYYVFLYSDNVPVVGDVQSDEVEWAKFIDVNDARQLILKNQRSIIDNIRW